VPVTATVHLGATVTTTGVGSPDLTHIVVPYDGTNDSIVNGIALGSTVVINGQEKTVTAINEYPINLPSVPLAYAVITLNTALSGVPGTGVVVGERKTVSTTVTAGTISTSGVDVTVSDTLTAISCAGGGATITSGAVLNTYTSGVGTLTKKVRNVTTASGSGNVTIYGGNNYYPSNVTAKPGDVLEYILISSTSSAGAVQAAVVTDAIPTSYVTFQAGVYPGSKDITYVDEFLTAHYLTQGAGDDAAVYSAPNLTVNLGGVNPPIPPLGGGTIPVSSTVYVLYRVQVNP